MPSYLPAVRIREAVPVSLLVPPPGAKTQALLPAPPLIAPAVLPCYRVCSHVSTVAARSAIRGYPWGRNSTAIT